MAFLFDTHAHYTDEKFGDPTELLNSLFSGDICGILCAGTDEKTSIQSIALAQKYEKGGRKHPQQEFIRMNAARRER